MASTSSSSAETCGPLDLLGAIGDGESYEMLLTDSEPQQLGDLTVRILSLPALIRLKQRAARDKDVAVLAILRRTLDEKTRGGK